jgi:Fic family protein
VDLNRYRGHALGEVRRTPGRHGYHAFFPATLPRRVELSGETATMIGEAEAALGRLDGVTRLLPNPNLLVRPAVMRAAVASTRIEGTQASIAEVYDADASNQPLSPDVEEVASYVRAMDEAVAALARLPVSARLVRETHAILLEGVRGAHQRPGEFRTTQNWLGSPGSTIETASFVPPPPDAMVKAFDDWERFVNEAPAGIPLLAQAALMHYQFEAIHPFLDGNGRLGRLLIVLFLVARGRLTRPVLSVSPYFEGRRDIYIGHLQSVHETGDVDPWVRFFAAAVDDSATDGVRRALLLVDLREGYRRRVPAQANLHSLIDLTFESPVLTGRLVEQRLGVTRPTALRLLTVLAEHAVLRERSTGPRAQRRWDAPDIMSVLTAGPQEQTPVTPFGSP